MGRKTNIEWCDHTWNPWIGCTKISPGCLKCYAENLMDKRWKRVGWGRGNPRQRTSESYWRQPLDWDRAAKDAGERRKVFCASLADVFDPEVPDQWRSDLFTLIAQTEHLDWLLLTKRPDFGIEQFGVWQEINEKATRAIWFGISAEDQERFDERADYLTDIRLAENTTFVSAEPLLGAINLCSCRQYIDWVIVGGESGPGARPMQKYWVRSIQRQCRFFGIPFFFKQWGGVNKSAAGNVLDGRKWLEMPPAKPRNSTNNEGTAKVSGLASRLMRKLLVLAVGLMALAAAQAQVRLSDAQIISELIGCRKSPRQLYKIECTV